MKNGLHFFKISTACGILLAFLLFIPSAILAFDFSEWSHGASGYDDAMSEAMDEDKPMVLYFHTEWCKWSKKMNTEYLAEYDVSDFLSDIPKVEISPEQGDDEKALTDQYKVTGFPSFFVSVPSIDAGTERVYPFKKGGAPVEYRRQAGGRNRDGNG